MHISSSNMHVLRKPRTPFFALWFRGKAMMSFEFRKRTVRNFMMSFVTCGHLWTSKVQLKYTCLGTYLYRNT